VLQFLYCFFRLNMRAVTATTAFSSDIPISFSVFCASWCRCTHSTNPRAREKRFAPVKVHAESVIADAEAAFELAE
jgi:hypothetical protein